MPKYRIEFIDTFGGEANFSCSEKYEIEAKSFKQAITLAKKKRYPSPIPRHTVNIYCGDYMLIDLVGVCVCCFIIELED